MAPPGGSGERAIGYLITRVAGDRKSTRLNSSQVKISYAVFCLKKKKNIKFNLQINNKKKKINILQINNKKIKSKQGFTKYGMKIIFYYSIEFADRKFFFNIYLTLLDQPYFLTRRAKD